MGEGFTLSDSVGGEEGGGGGVIEKNLKEGGIEEGEDPTNPILIESEGKEGHFNILLAKAIKGFGKV